MGNTTKVTGHNGTSHALATGVWGNVSGTFQPAREVWGHNGSIWVGAYSVIVCTSASNPSATGSGASSSGTATTSATGINTVTGAIGSLSYAWTYQSGDASISPSNSAIAQPTWSRAFSGVSNGTTSSTVNAVWLCTMTDGQTGATTTTTVTISLAWQNTIPAFAGSDNTYTTDQTINIPAGATSVRIIAVTGVGSGGFGDTQEPGPTNYFGGNGGGGAAIDFTRSCTSGNSFSFTIASVTGYGNGGGVVISGSVSGGAMATSATGGNNGGSASFATGADGTGGTGSGWTTGTTGAGSTGGSAAGDFGGNRGIGSVRVIISP